MAGILPDAINGGLEIRNLAGVCTPQSNVNHSYCPPSQFASTCAITALPNDCTARITPGQINGIVSELLCFAQYLSPNGPWNCSSLCNLSASFNTWFLNFPIASDTIRGITALAVGANFPVQEGNDIDAATPAFIRALENEMYVRLPAAPLPQIGKRWENTNIIPISGISAGATGVWDGTAWIQEDFGTVFIGFASNGLFPINVLVQPTIASINTGKIIEYLGFGGPGISLVAGKYAVSCHFMFFVTTATGSPAHALSFVGRPLINGAPTATLASLQVQFPTNLGSSSVNTLAISEQFITINAGDVLSAEVACFNFLGTITGSIFQPGSFMTIRRVQ